MSQVPCFLIQYHFIQKVQRELHLSEDGWEYAVSAKWIDITIKYASMQDQASKDILPLFAADSDFENVYICERNWKVLASWYGLDKNYTFKRRPTISRYVNILEISQHHTNHAYSTSSSTGFVLVDNKLDFITVNCCNMKDFSTNQEKRPCITLFFWDSLKYVEFQVRCALKIHPKNAVRMWFSFADDGADQFFEDISTSRSPNESIGSIICSNCAEVLDMLVKRQSLPTPDQPGTPGITMMSSISPIREELSSMFMSNLWQVTVWLEELPTNKTFSVESQHASPKNLPEVFHNVPIDHFFYQEKEIKSWEDTLKDVLDGSAENFVKLIEDQKKDMFSRASIVLQDAEESFKAKKRDLQARMEYLDLQESQLHAREKEMNERDHELNSKLAKFKSMLTEFLMKKDKFDKDSEIMAEQNKITATRVDLNVGGVRYTTSITTLIKEEGSLLHTMFGGQHRMNPDKDGSYFIDRDGTNFRYILNFLRDGQTSLEHLPQGDVRLISELRTEAEYYKLRKMIDVLKAMMSAQTSGGGGYSSLQLSTKGSTSF